MAPRTSSARRRSLSPIESGKANVTVATLAALARAYRIELSGLFLRS